MNQILIQYWKSPVGNLILGVYNNELCLCDWQHRKMREQIDTRIQNGLKANYITEESELHQKAITQLTEYINKERKVFDLPLLFVGSYFQKTIWQLLLQIPYGATCSYIELAKQYGDEKAIRAVAAANGANALSIFVPCHRVIAQNGNLTGYAGGLPAKQKLLELEGDEGSKQILMFYY